MLTGYMIKYKIITKSNEVIETKDFLETKFWAIKTYLDKVVESNQEYIEDVEIFKATCFGTYKNITKKVNKFLGI